MTIPAAPHSAELRRALGRWDLTAIGVNQVIGGAIFAMPAVIAARVGAWSPWLIVAVGVASLLIAASLAELSSRFETTGGPYIYARAAFGRFVGFEVGWLQWFTRVASWASVINVLVASLGFYWPALTEGAVRFSLLTGVIVLLASINILGIRQSAWVLNALTIAKLAPIALFIVVGLPAVDGSRLHTGGLPSLGDAATTALLLVFTFGGYEVIPVPAGESKDPRRAAPFALIATIVIVTLAFVLTQVVALGTLPGLTASKTPLADASALLMGGAGAAIVTLGAVFSTLGNNMGQCLSGSRMLFALAEERDLPGFVAYVHPGFRTPVNAILCTAAVSLVLAATGTFVTMAAASAVSRLLVFVVTCGATLRLRATDRIDYEAIDHTGLVATDQTDHIDLRATDHTDHTGLGATDHADHTGLTATDHTDHTGLRATDHTDHTGLRATDHTDHTGLGATDHTDHTGLRDTDHTDHPGLRFSEASFRTPFGPVVPLAALATVVAILLGATTEQKIGGLVTLGVGAAFFGIAVVTGRRR